MRRGLLGAVIVVLAALAAGGCAARAKAVVEPGPLELEVPAPPPRVIVPPDPEVPVLPPQPSSSDPVAPKTPRKPSSAPAPARVEPRPETIRPALPPPASPGLEQALPSSPSDLVRQVREQLNLAQRDLDRVDYAALSTDRRAQYDTAKRFIAQAEQALREKNLVFASRVAEKAAGLAASLAGRLAP